jgi:two-component system, cell cycle sensor histidine kinase and response regulator CckA
MLRVLVVDDDQMILGLISAYLERSGCDVLTACNGREAVEVFQSCPDLIDLVLTDVVMPVMSGHEAARLIWATRPDAKVIWMTGYPDEPLPKGAAVLLKPFRFEALQRAISEAIGDGGSILSLPRCYER